MPVPGGRAALLAPGPPGAAHAPTPNPVRD